MRPPGPPLRHVLWHAHASKLWDRFVIDVRRRLASSADLVQSRFAEHARLSFARVAEYQKREAVHVHAVVRLDGPIGCDGEPPAWGTVPLLIDAVRKSARRVLVHSSYSPAVGERVLRWGEQIDARPLRTDGEGPDGDAVAAYVAKYVTKGASETGAGLDHPLTTWADIESVPVSTHVRTLMRACWRLGGLPEYEPLRLRPWTHTLGYRGHILTKSRAYSTTYAALRAERAHHKGHTDTPTRSPNTTGATSAPAPRCPHCRRDRRRPCGLQTACCGSPTSGGIALTTTFLPKRGTHVSPLPSPGNAESSAATVIESEIVIVDDDGTEEPFDPASWFA
ncbi:replication initiator [Streptomyces sp. YKOK-I1]